MPFRSALACAVVTPGLSRANTCMPRLSRRVGSAIGASGIHSRCVSGNLKPSGMTPITVCGRPLTVIERPTTAGSPAYRRRHTSSDRRTTGSAPSRSSAGPKSRPRAGGVPRRPKSVADTAAPTVPLRLAGAVRNRQAAALECGQRGKRRRPVAPVLEVGIRHAGTADVLFRVGAVQDHDPVGFRIRVGLEQHPVDDAEDRTVDPDSQRQAQHRDEGEARIRDQRPEGVAKVLEHT